MASNRILEDTQLASINDRNVSQIMRDWADLPEELLNLILSKLFNKDRRIFSLVCRSWNSTSATSPYQCHSPCLMFYEADTHLWKFFQYKGFFYMSFPELDKAAIRCSKYGWLLISGDDRKLFFFNPFNKQRIELPCKIDYRYATISFFHQPTSPDCIIVGMAKQSKYHVRIGVLKRGEDDWKSYCYNRRHPLVSPSAPVLHRGNFYFLDVNGNVAKFNTSCGHDDDDDDDDEEEGYWILFTKCLWPSRLRKRIKQCFLLKVEGEESLFAVFEMHDEREIKVYKLLEPLIDWELVQDLGDKMLYLSNTSCFGDIAHLNKSMANKIYIPKSRGDNVVFYSLNTRKYHCIDGGYSSNNAYGLKRLNFASWVLPSPTPVLSRELTWCQKVDVVGTN